MDQELAAAVSEQLQITLRGMCKLKKYKPIVLQILSPSHGVSRDDNTENSSMMFSTLLYSFLVDEHLNDATTGFVIINLVEKTEKSSKLLVGIVVGNVLFL